MCLASPSNHEDIVAFLARQGARYRLAEEFSRTPILRLSRRPESKGGMNFVRGALNSGKTGSSGRRVEASGHRAFQVGRDVAITPGKVVFRIA